MFKFHPVHSRLAPLPRRKDRRGLPVAAHDSLFFGHSLRPWESLIGAGEPEPLRVALAQLRCSARPGENIAATNRAVRAAARRGAGLCVLPELFTNPYRGQFDDVRARLEGVPDQEALARCHGNDSARRSLRQAHRAKDGAIRIATVHELHEDVFRDIEMDAGQGRWVNVRIAGMKHPPPPMEKVVPMMAHWEEDKGRRDMLGEDVFALAAWMHFEFESIDPFSDGNGRVGRLLLNLHFLKHAWPTVHVLPADRDRYFACLVHGHDCSLAELEGFLRVAMARSLRNLLDNIATREDERRSLRTLSKQSPYSAKCLSLRAGQEELPAVKIRGGWHPSQRALRLCRDAVARGTRRARRRKSSPV